MDGPPEIKEQVIFLKGYDVCERDADECSSFVSRLIKDVLKTEEIVQVKLNIQADKIMGHDGLAKPGVSIMFTFLESGGMLHTWPEVLYASLLIDSCKAFDARKVQMEFDHFFYPRNTEVKEL